MRVGVRARKSDLISKRAMKLVQNEKGNQSEIRERDTPYGVTWISWVLARPRPNYNPSQTWEKPISALKQSHQFPATFIARIDFEQPVNMYADFHHF